MFGRNDFHYNADNSVALSQQIPQGPSKNSAANEVYWQYDSSRLVSFILQTI